MTERFLNSGTDPFMKKEEFDQRHQKSEFEKSIRFLRDLAAKD
ncbi:MAG: hypothetical protein ACKVJX_19575 [Verrucomicrobiia bacterium]|jgi:hypothetical protein